MLGDSTRLMLFRELKEDALNGQIKAIISVVKVRMPLKSIVHGMRVLPVSRPILPQLLNWPVPVHYKACKS